MNDNKIWNQSVLQQKVRAGARISSRWSWYTLKKALTQISTFLKIHCFFLNSDIKLLIYWSSSWHKVGARARAEPKPFLKTLQSLSLFFKPLKQELMQFFLHWSWSHFIFLTGAGALTNVENQKHCDISKTCKNK